MERITTVTLTHGSNNHDRHSVDYHHKPSLHDLDADAARNHNNLGNSPAVNQQVGNQDPGHQATGDDSVPSNPLI